MGNEVLSQDEVDALLQGFNGDSAEEESKQPEEGVRSYDLARQERIVRGRMPTLEVINERFARLLRIGIFNFMRRTPEVAINPIRVIKYGEFIRNLVVPTNLNVVHMKPLRGSALIIIEPSLVFNIIDNLFGSDGRYHTRIEGRDFTLTEQRIIQRVLNVVFTEYQKAWEPIHPVEFEFVRAEMHTQFANIANPSEVVVTSTFNLDLGGKSGDIHFCFPYSMLEPIRDVLYSMIQGESAEPDKRWLRMLTKQVQIAEVELVVRLADVPVELRQVLNMKAGDVVRFDLPKLVSAEVDGVPLFNCTYGTVDGRYAVKINEVTAPSRLDNLMSGDEHA